MIFTDLQGGDRLFVDANVLVYHFGSHGQWGPACTQLIERFEKQELTPFTSTHVLSEAAHHLMTLEAARHFGWTSKIVQHLKQQPASIQQLQAFRQAVEKVPQLGIQVLTVPPDLVATAATLSQQHGLLSNDALIVAMMQANGLVHLASADSDFDRVSGITRYGPV